MAAELDLFLHPDKLPVERQISQQTHDSTQGAQAARAR